MGKIVCLLLVWFTGFKVLAQSEITTTTRNHSTVTGFRAGANLSKITGQDHYLGYHVGLFADMRSNKFLGYEPGINYSRQYGTLGNSKVILDYINLPILLNFYLGKTALQGGFYGAALIQARSEFQNFYNITSGIKNLDYGLAFGVKRDLGQVGIGLRYFTGLTRIINSRNGDAKNQNIQFSILINF